jgi:hypothetical protein
MRMLLYIFGSVNWYKIVCLLEHIHMNESKNIKHHKMWDLHGSEDFECGLLGCRCNLVAGYQHSNTLFSFRLAHGISGLKFGGGMFLHNIGTHLPDRMVS